MPLTDTTYKWMCLVCPFRWNMTLKSAGLEVPGLTTTHCTVEHGKAKQICKKIVKAEASIHIKCAILKY